MMSLSEQFQSLFEEQSDKAAAIVLEAPESEERDGLLLIMYAEGIGVGKDDTRALALAEKLKVSQTKWGEYAHLWLGDYYMGSNRGDDTDKAIDHYLEIGDTNGEAACRLADIFWNIWSDLDDESVRPEVEHTLFYYTELAAAYNPEYLLQLGHCYAIPIGCEKIESKAIACFEQFFKLK